MRKDFYIFRHGETDLNKAGRRQGQKIDAELNATGVAQAENLAKKLENSGIEKIYSSPLKRALKTASIVSDKLGVEIEFAEGLKEGCFGVFEGLYKHEVDEKYAEASRLWDSLDEKHFDYRLPQGESKRELSERMHGVLSSLIDSEYSKIGISTHGRITRLYLYSLGLKLEWMENAAVYHVIYEDGIWRVEGEI